MAERQGRVTDRHAPPVSPSTIIALVISAIGLLLGPCFGAGVAVIGNYVMMQTRSAVSDAKLDAIEKKVDKIDTKVEVGTGGIVELKTKVDAEAKRTDEAFAKIGTLEAHDSKQETQYAELIGMLNKK